MKINAMLFIIILQFAQSVFSEELIMYKSVLPNGDRVLASRKLEAQKPMTNEEKTEFEILTKKFLENNPEPGGQAIISIPDEKIYHYEIFITSVEGSPKKIWEKNITEFEASFGAVEGFRLFDIKSLNDKYAIAYEDKNSLYVDLIDSSGKVEYKEKVYNSGSYRPVNSACLVWLDDLYIVVQIPGETQDQKYYVEMWRIENGNVKFISSDSKGVSPVI